MNPAAPSLSLVIPLYNEEESVLALFEAVRQALDRRGYAYEVIAVDDGSTDGTPLLLEQVHKEDPRWTVLSLRRNFGQTAALSAGFDLARGQVVVTLDGDLQNDPEDIPQLLTLLETSDIVSGWRADRQDPFWHRRLPSLVGNTVISWVTGTKLHDYGCTLKAYRKEVLDNLKLYGELHRFIPAIASGMGISIAEVKVRHHPRRAGLSKYGLARTIRVVLDLIAVKFLLSFVTRPIQAFGLVGLLVGAAGFGISLYLTVLKLVFGQEIGDRPLLLLGILLLLLGVQLVGMGLLGEMLARVYHEAVGKPIYMVKSILREGDRSNGG